MKTSQIQRLIKVRKEFKLSQSGLALILGKSLSIIAKTESEEIPASAKYILDFRIMFNLRPEWLEQGIGEQYINGEKPTLTLIVGAQKGAHNSHLNYASIEHSQKQEQLIQTLQQEVESLTVALTVMSRKVNFPDALYLFPSVLHRGAQYGAQLIASA